MLSLSIISKTIIVHFRLKNSTAIKILCTMLVPHYKKDAIACVPLIESPVRQLIGTMVEENKNMVRKSPGRSGKC